MSSRIAAAAVAALLVTACSSKDKTVDSAATASPPPPPPAAPALSLADVAGKWQMRSVPESGDTTPTTYVLTATADTTGWMITFPTGLKVPLHVMISGDSIIEKTGVYTSQRRKGAKVMTEGVARLQGGKLVGTTVAHYQSGKDSVLRLHSEGTKVP